MEKMYVGKMAQEAGLTLKNTEIETENREFLGEDINRPALQLTGFFDHFDANRVQVIGNVERAFIETLSEERKVEVFDKLFSFNIPCIVYCRGHKPDDSIMEQADKYGIPVYVTDVGTSETSSRILRYIQERTAPELTIHGVLIDVFGTGVLITGESGIGKSEAALELIKRGHRLVADDAVTLWRVSNTCIKGRAPEVTKHFIELRGIGIIDVKTLFGVESVEDEKKVDMVIYLEDWDREKTYDRLGKGDQYVEYLGNRLICYSIPIRPGRNLAVIVETAAINYRQKQMGYDATEELYKRVQNNFLKNM
jgi:HPr kinase/phosphorylase